MADMRDAKRSSGVIAVEEVRPEETSHYGIVQPEAGADDVFRVVNLVEKPAPKDAPSNLAHRRLGQEIATAPDIRRVKNIVVFEREIWLQICALHPLVHGPAIHQRGVVRVSLCA